jgi:hypothetical protein
LRCGKVYLGVDYDQNIFKLAHINPDAVIPVPVPFQQRSSALSATSIGLVVIGIVLAPVLACILDILLVILCIYPGKVGLESNKDKEIEPKKETAERETIRVTRGRGYGELRTVAEVRYCFPIGVIRSYQVYKSRLK